MLVAARLGKRFVEQSAYATPSVVRVNTDKMHVPGSNRMVGNEAQEKANDEPIFLDNARLFAEFVKEDRVRKGADRPSPPTIDDAYYVVEIGFGQGTSAHAREHFPNRPHCIEKYGGPA
jgi:hypothetical protein